MRTDGTILIVDDDQDLRMTLADILQVKGFAVVDASGGKTALQMLSQENPAVVLIDLRLPDMDGLELLQRIRQLSPGTECIVVTGYASQASAIRAVNLGAYSYVQKPYDVEQLLVTIRRAMERRQAEAALRESEESYRMLVRASPDAVIASNLEGRISFFSQRAIDLFGAGDAGDYSGRSLTDLVAAEDHDRLRRGLDTVIQEGAVRDLELRLLRRDGSCFFGEFSAALVRDAYGNPKGVIATAKDISVRKQRDRELKTLADLAIALRMAQTRSDIITIVLDEVLELLDVDHAALVVGDVLAVDHPDTMVCKVEQGRGDWAGIAGQTLPVGDCSLPREGVVRDTHPLDQDRSTSALRIPELFHGRNAAAGTPLIAQSRTIGALFVGREAPITAEERHLLSAVGDMAATAIYRTSLFDQTRLRLQRLASLRIVDMSINSSLDMRATLNILLDQLTAQLHVDAAGILRFHSGEQSLEFIVGRGIQARPANRFIHPIGSSVAGMALTERRTLFVVRQDNPDSGATEDPASAWFRERGLTEEKFSAYHAVPLIVVGQVQGVLELFHRRLPEQTSEWLEFLETMAGQAAITINNASLFEGLERSKADLELAYDTTLEGWVRTLDMRDREIEGHTRRVTEMTLQLARSMNLAESALVHVRRGALLHDIGKMAIPDSILRKPGPLTDAEWEIMRQHPRYALDLLMPIVYLQPAIDIPYCHHELWNGTGYPRGLEGNSIPLAARIFTVVDNWDALHNDRPYRRGWPTEKIVKHLKKESGHTFDPEVVAAFLPLIRS
jgi:PAS domain S-box-containing protein